MPLNSLRQAIEQNAVVTQQIYEAYIADDRAAIREHIHELDLICADLNVALEELEAQSPLHSEKDDCPEQNGAKPTTPKR